MFTTIWSNRFTALTRLITHTAFPKPLVKLAINVFIKSYPINLDEIEHPLSSFTTLDAFFTRSLKPSSRPIHSNKTCLLSPVDALVQEFGSIHEGQLIQAKGVTYLVKDLCPNATESYEGGSFITFYLAPFDCHRIFMPCDGTIIMSEHVPGVLVPVREPYISNYPNLYTKNERLISYIQSDFGQIAVVKVGALNVGSITTTYDPTIRTNISNKQLSKHIYDSPMSYSAGQHLATFHLGSTVIMLIPLKNAKWTIKKGQTVKYGQPVFYLESKKYPAN